MAIDYQIRDLESPIEEEMKIIDKKRLTSGVLIILRKIICSFIIHDLYPFGLLDIKLASNVDIQSLERQLIRKTKPGFGYISRICDMIKILCNSSKF